MKFWPKSEMSFESVDGNNPDEKKKICVSYFFMRNPYMKFQNPSIHSSKVMQCITMCNGRREKTPQKQYAPPISSKLGA